MIYTKLAIGDCTLQHNRSHCPHLVTIGLCLGRYVLLTATLHCGFCILVWASCPAQWLGKVAQHIGLTLLVPAAQHISLTLLGPAAQPIGFTMLGPVAQHIGLTLLAPAAQHIGSTLL